VIDLVQRVRNARAEARIEPGTWRPVDIAVPDRFAATFGELAPAIERLTRAGPLRLQAGRDDMTEVSEGDLSIVAGDLEAVVRAASGGGESAAGGAGGAGGAADHARLEKELADAERFLEAARARLANETFMAKAPPAVVDGARAREAELVDTVDRLRRRLRT
jgi:valyl-tRNA synthetase